MSFKSLVEMRKELTSFKQEVNDKFEKIIDRLYNLEQRVYSLEGFRNDTDTKILEINKIKEILQDLKNKIIEKFPF